jgi:mono/diheme cytochrome c family protein
MKTYCACSSAILVALTMALIFVPIRVRAQNAAQAMKPSEAPSGNAENGKRLFTKYGCYECHGREGQGSSMTGPRLAPNPIPFEVFVPYVRKPMREMPPYTAKVVSDQELADIYTFLQSRPHPPVAKSIPF